MTTTIYVQYEDDTEKTIIAVYGCAQDPDFYPHQGEIPSEDPRYVTYYGAQFPQAQHWLTKPGD